MPLLNDVLPSTRLQGSNGAALNLGGFGYKPDDPGPGVLVSMLPDKYSGPLKMGDRIAKVVCKRCGGHHRHRTESDEGAKPAAGADASEAVTRRENGAEPDAAVDAIEAPFLQLVMERIWRATVAAGSRELTRARLD